MTGDNDSADSITLTDLEDGITQNKTKLNIDDLAKLHDLQQLMTSEMGLLSRELNFKHLLVWMLSGDILKR